MKKYIFIISLLAMTLSVQAKSKKKAATPTPGALKEVLANNGILLGAAINQWEVAGEEPGAQQAIIANFNSAEAENCMKAEVIHPREGEYDWTLADQFIDFCQKNNITAIGHCLVWHSQPAKWMFKDKNGEPSSRPLLIDRMKEHIFTVMQRYKGKVKGWDVVNEAINDDGTLRVSPWSQLIGPDWIELAFRFAHEADPDAELYINDYSMAKPAKREAYLRLIKDFQQKGIRIDAIGMQSHNGADYPDLVEYEKTLEAYAATGLKVMMTELDLNMLPNPKNWDGGAEVSNKAAYEEAMNPYKNGLTAEAQQLFNERYLAFFGIYARHKASISRINLWGASDKNSWLNNWPIKGRTSYPLLLDRQYKPKPVVNDIIKLFE